MLFFFVFLDETMDEFNGFKTLDTVDEADLEDSESDDETDTNEPDHLDLIDDKKDMIYDDDVAYEPIEEGNKSDSEVIYKFFRKFTVFFISLFNFFDRDPDQSQISFFLLANLLFISQRFFYFLISFKY